MAFSLIHSGAMPTAGKTADIVAETAFIGDFRRNRQNTRVVYAGAQMKNGRYTYGHTDFTETGASVLKSVLRR